jgi:Protein of unknown function (DUF3551)
MKAFFGMAASVAAFVALTLIVTEGAAAAASPGPQRESFCLVLGEGGTDCSFISYAQCQASASGRDASCYAAPPANPADNESGFVRNGRPRR